MKTYRQTARLSCLLVALNWFGASASFAGPSTSGGGGAFVCPVADSAGFTAKLVDLWEARFLPRLKDHYLISVDSKVSMEEQAVNAVRAIGGVSSALATELETVLRQVMEPRNQFQLGPDISLEAPRDALNPFHPTGCELHGMMYFDDLENLLYIKPEIFDALESPTEKAAAFVHETVYKWMRSKAAGPGGGRIHAASSELARRLTACLFSSTHSGEQCWQKFEFIAAPPGPGTAVRYVCDFGDNRFYIAPEDYRADENLRPRFNGLAGGLRLYADRVNGTDYPNGVKYDSFIVAGPATNAEATISFTGVKARLWVSELFRGFMPPVRDVHFSVLAANGRLYSTDKKYQCEKLTLN